MWKKFELNALKNSDRKKFVIEKKKNFLIAIKLQPVVQ